MLKDIIEYFEALPPDTICKVGFYNPHSYRGFYEQLAFEPGAAMLVEEVLEVVKPCLGKTFEGYKGGDFVMKDYTECWFAYEGHVSEDQIGPMLLKALTDSL